MNEEIQGFFTSENVFVDRIEAKKIALEYNQISLLHDKEFLYSEYISW